MESSLHSSILSYEPPRLPPLAPKLAVPEAVVGGDVPDDVMAALIEQRAQMYMEDESLIGAYAADLQARLIALGEPVDEDLLADIAEYGAAGDADDQPAPSTTAGAVVLGVDLRQETTALLALGQSVTGGEAAETDVIVLE